VDNFSKIVLCPLCEGLQGFKLDPILATKKR